MLASLQNRLAFESATSTKDDVTPSTIWPGLAFIGTPYLSHPAGHASETNAMMDATLVVMLS